MRQIFGWLKTYLCAAGVVWCCRGDESSMAARFFFDINAQNKNKLNPSPRLLRPPPLRFPLSLSDVFIPNFSGRSVITRAYPSQPVSCRCFEIANGVQHSHTFSDGAYLRITCEKKRNSIVFNRVFEIMNIRKRDVGAPSSQPPGSTVLPISF